MLVLRFDDFAEEEMTKTLPVLQDEDVNAVFSVPIRNGDPGGLELETKHGTTGGTRKEVRTLAARGGEIASHGLYNAFLNELPLASDAAAGDTTLDVGADFDIVAENTPYIISDGSGSTYEHITIVNRDEESQTIELARPLDNSYTMSGNAYIEASSMGMYHIARESRRQLSAIGSDVRVTSFVWTRGNQGQQWGIDAVAAAGYFSASDTDSVGSSALSAPVESFSLSGQKFDEDGMTDSEVTAFLDDIANTLLGSRLLVAVARVAPRP